jgi:hypothetical protein
MVFADVNLHSRIFNVFTIIYYSRNAFICEERRELVTVEYNLIKTGSFFSIKEEKKMASKEELVKKDEVKDETKGKNEPKNSK